MLNKEKHQLIMGRILMDIYTNISIASFLGFKGGTCAYLFYGLPRFSVDLDFDLLVAGKQKPVFDELKNILNNYGKIKDSYIKRNTVFFLLSYGEEDYNIKIEVSTREKIPNIENHFDLREYLGISMLVAKKPYLFASKLAALTLRKETAVRDIYDIWYFAENSWDIDREVLKAWTEKELKEYLGDCILFIEKIKDNQMLKGIGELVKEEEKKWIKNELKKEVVFLLKNYQSVI